jgi:hypothetical protein
MNIARRLANEQPSAGQRVSALSMYEIPPTEPISVSEFEEFAFDRLRCALCPWLPCCYCVPAPPLTSPVPLASAEFDRARARQGPPGRGPREEDPKGAL